MAILWSFLQTLGAQTPADDQSGAIPFPSLSPPADNRPVGLRNFPTSSSAAASNRRIDGTSTYVSRAQATRRRGWGGYFAPFISRMGYNGSIEVNCIEGAWNRLLANLGFTELTYSDLRIIQRCSVLEYVPNFQEAFKMLRKSSPMEATSVIEVQTVIVEFSVETCSVFAGMKAETDILYATSVYMDSLSAGIPKITITDYEPDAPRGFDGDRRSEMWRAMTKGSNNLWCEWKGRFTVTNKNERLRNCDGNIFEAPVETDDVEDTEDGSEDPEIDTPELHVVTISMIQKSAEIVSPEASDDAGHPPPDDDGLEWWEMGDLANQEYEFDFGEENDSDEEEEEEEEEEEDDGGIQFRDDSDSDESDGGESDEDSSEEEDDEDSADEDGSDAHSNEEEYDEEEEVTKAPTNTAVTSSGTVQRLKVFDSESSILKPKINVVPEAYSSDSDTTDSNSSAYSPATQAFPTETELTPASSPSLSVTKCLDDSCSNDGESANPTAIMPQGLSRVEMAHMAFGLSLELPEDTLQGMENDRKPLLHAEMAKNEKDPSDEEDSEEGSDDSGEEGSGNGEEEDSEEDPAADEQEEDVEDNEEGDEKDE